MLSRLRGLTSPRPLLLVAIIIYTAFEGAVELADLMYPSATHFALRYWLIDLAPEVIGIRLPRFWYVETLPVLLGGVYLIAAYGLWCMRKWGFWFAVAFNALRIALSISELFRMPFIKAMVLMQCEVLATCIFILWYLLRPRIRSLFRG